MPPRRFPRLTSLQAGGWGLPGTGIRRPKSAPLEAFTGSLTQQIRPGEGTATGTVPASGTLTLLLGPDGLATWYVTYVAISTTTGALDASTANVTTGPAVATGIVAAGTAYSGGGDSVGLGGAALACGEYVIVTWTGAHPGDQAMMRVYGNSQVLV
jgi:hypothetical protein